MTNDTWDYQPQWHCDEENKEVIDEMVSLLERWLSTKTKTTTRLSPIEGMFLRAVNGIHPTELRGLVSQHKVGSYRLDFALPKQKIGIELDGHATHSSASAIAADRKRQRNLEADGWHIIRFGGSEVYHDAPACVREAAKLVRIKRRHR